MAIFKVYPPVRPLDPVYLDLVTKSMHKEDLLELRAAIEKYNKTCVAAAKKLNEFCINKLKLPPEM